MLELESESMSLMDDGPTAADLVFFLRAHQACHWVAMVDWRSYVESLQAEFLHELTGKP